MGKESSGNYDAKNPDSGASGAYQIMPENWPSWSQEAGLPPGSPMTPENQEKVVDYKLGQYFDIFRDNSLVAAAWYAGPAYAKALQAGNPPYDPNKGLDANGIVTDNPDLVKYPSVNSYVKSVMSNFGNVVEETKGSSSDDKYVTIPELGRMTVKQALDLKGKYEAYDYTTTDAYGNQIIKHNPGNPKIVALIDSVINPAIEKAYKKAEKNKTVDYNEVMIEITESLEENAKAPAGKKLNRQQMEDLFRKAYGDWVMPSINFDYWFPPEKTLTVSERLSKNLSGLNLSGLGGRR